MEEDEDLYDDEMDSDYDDEDEEEDIEELINHLSNYVLVEIRSKDHSMIMDNETNYIKHPEFNLSEEDSNSNYKRINSQSSIDQLIFHSSISATPRIKQKEAKTKGRDEFFDEVQKRETSGFTPKSSHSH